MKKLDFVDGKVEALKVINDKMRVRTSFFEEEVAKMEQEESKDIPGYEVLANGEYYLKTINTKEKKPKFDDIED